MIKANCVPGKIMDAKTPRNKQIKIITVTPIILNFSDLVLFLKLNFITQFLQFSQFLLRYYSYNKPYYRQFQFQL